MHLVMFDIDGTLVDSAGFDAQLYVEAVRNVLNVEVDSDWNAYEHVSDSGILEEVLRDAGLDAEREHLAARVQQRFVGLVRDYLKRGPGAICEIAGAKRLIERLLELPNVRVGVATGGWEPTALLSSRTSASTSGGSVSRAARTRGRARTSCGSRRSVRCRAGRLRARLTSVTAHGTAAE